MKVLIIVENLPVPFDRRVWQEACTLRDAGYEVSVICPKGRNWNRSFEVIDGIHVFRHSLPTEGRGVLGYALEYPMALFHEFRLSWKVFMGRGFDVIQACNPPDTIWIVAGFYKLLFGKTFIYDQHDLCPELYLAKFGKRNVLFRLMLLLERCAFRTADASIATNESFRKVAIERGGMEPGRVFVVRSGPPLDMVAKSDAPECPGKAGRHFVGYAGIMGKQDGVSYLIGAARHIVRNLGRRDVHFVIVGDGAELRNLRAMAAAYRVEEFVTFTGSLPYATYMKVLAQTDVCVCPEGFNEMSDKSTMNKVMDYMAVGKPIVQFDLAENRFTAGDAALYARRDDETDLAEKIVLLIDNPELRETMGRYGRTRIEKTLNWRQEEPQLLAAYRKALSGKRPRTDKAPAVAARGENRSVPAELPFDRLGADVSGGTAAGTGKNRGVHA